MKNAFVTGAAGFIGSTLTDRLLATNAEIQGAQTHPDSGWTGV